MLTAEKPQTHITMKEKILQRIKQQLGNTQLSDRTLNEVAVNYLSKTITSDEMLTDDAIAAEVARLKVLEGQLNHEVAEKLKSQKPTSTTVVESPKETPAPKMELPKEILEELEASRKFRQEYLQQQETLKQQATKEKLFNDVKDALSKAGCTDELMVRITMPQIDYSKSAEDNIAKLKDVYNSELATYKSKQGYIPSNTTSQAPASKTKEEIAAEQKARAEKFKEQGLMN